MTSPSRSSLSAALALLASGSLLAGCASHYALRPALEEPTVLDKIPQQSLVTKDCELYVAYEQSYGEETTLRLRVKNTGKKSQEWEPAMLVLSGEALASPPATGVVPEPYLAKLRSDADLFERRADQLQKNWEGVDSLTQSVQDDETKKLGKELEKRKKESADDVARAKKNREKAEKLKGLNLLAKETLAPGQAMDKLVLVPVEFKRQGPARLSVVQPACEGEMDFEVVRE